MLTDAFQGGDDGFPIRYRFDDKLFHLKRLQAKSKVQTGLVDEPMAKNASTERKMQEALGRDAKACDNYDLKNQHEND